MISSQFDVRDMNGGNDYAVLRYTALAVFTRAVKCIPDVPHQ